MSSDITGLTGTSFTVLRLYENHIRDAFLLASMAFLGVAGNSLGLYLFCEALQNSSSNNDSKNNIQKRICRHSYTQSHTCKHMLIITHKYTRTKTYANTYTCKQMHTNTCTHAYTFKHIHMQTHARANIWTHIQTYTYIHMF